MVRVSVLSYPFPKNDVNVYLTNGKTTTNVSIVKSWINEVVIVISKPCKTSYS